MSVASGDPVRRAARVASTGMATHALRVTDVVGRYRLFVPDRSDVSAGRLADAVAVFSAVRRRFPEVRTPDLSFVDTRDGSGGRPGGLGGDGRVRISHEMLLDGSRTPPGWLRKVVAHECWHTIDMACYRETFEVRRGLGEELGLPTFEAAYVPMPGVTPEQRAAALERIRGAVGTYATTKAGEGTAELFGWWWVVRDPPELVAAFGRLVDRYLPAPVNP
jgi:hypothetical protein